MNQKKEKHKKIRQLALQSYQILVPELLNQLESQPKGKTLEDFFELASFIPKNLQSSKDPSSEEHMIKTDNHLLQLNKLAKDVAFLFLNNLLTKRMLQNLCNPIKALPMRSKNTKGKTAAFKEQSYLLPSKNGNLFSRKITLHLEQLLSNPEYDELWKPGNEDVAGLIYPFYNQPALSIYRTSQMTQVHPHMVANRTQIFTPQWIIKTLVENTLGKLWMEQHPDSSLIQDMKYYIPPNSSSNSLKKRCKSIRTIKVLDPACGAMFFGLYAFDLLYKMYLEELKQAGQKGWPSAPSVNHQGEIPSSILRNNLYGYDIDPVAIILSQTSLRLKALSYTTDQPLFKPNIVLKDVLQKSERLSSGIMMATKKPLFDIIVTNPPYLDSRDSDPDTKRLLKEYYPLTRRNLYSVFIEIGLDYLSPKGRLGMITPQSFMFLPSFASTRSLITQQSLVECLGHIGAGLFNDAVVDTAFFILQKQTNKQQRSNKKGLYLSLTKAETSEKKEKSFLKQLSLYQRNESGDTLYLKSQQDFKPIPGNPWVYWVPFSFLSLLKHTTPLGDKVEVKQGLATSDNFRFVRYWWEVYITGDHRKIYTLNNNPTIGFYFKDRKQAQESGKSWFPYMKGGSYKKWFGNQKYVVYWKNDGELIKSLRREDGKLLSRPQNLNYFFKEGLTFNLAALGDPLTNQFPIRYMPEGFIFDVGGSAVFPKSEELFYLMGILGSRFSNLCLSIFNPTINFQVGDVKKIPLKNHWTAMDQKRKTKIETSAKTLILLNYLFESYDETNFFFVIPPLTKDIKKAEQYMEKIQWEIKQQEENLNQVVLDLYSMDSLSLSLANKKAKQTRSKNKWTSKDIGYRWLSYIFGIAMGRFHPGKAGALGSAIISLNDPVLGKINDTLKNDPLFSQSFFPWQTKTRNGYWDAQNQYHFFSQNQEQRLQSFEYHKEIKVLTKLDASSPLVQSMLSILLILFSEEEAKDIFTITGLDWKHKEQSLHQWLIQSFWSFHLCLYHKKPIYWLFQSSSKAISAYIYFQCIHPKVLTQLMEHVKRASFTNPKEKAHFLYDLQETMNNIRNAPQHHFNIDGGILFNLLPYKYLIGCRALKKELDKVENRLITGERFR